MNTLGVFVLFAADLVPGIRRRLSHADVSAAHALPAIKEFDSSTPNTSQDTAEHFIHHWFLWNLPGPFLIVPSPSPPLWKISMTVGPPPPPPPHEESPHFASDLFLASMLLDLNPDNLDAQAPHPPNFASLFDNQLTIPPHMGATNEKKVAPQRRRNVSYFEREHQSPGFGASGLVATAACGSSGQAEDSTLKETLFGLMNAWFMNLLRPQQRKTHHALTDVTSSSPPDSSCDASSRPDLGELLLPTGHNKANRWLLT
jgi:hypothetical protein